MGSLRLTQYEEVAGKRFGTPKEVWGFRLAAGAGSPWRVAIKFLAANADRFGLRGLRFRRRNVRVIESLGARHVIFQQRLHGLRIRRAFVTVHVSRDGHVYLAKNGAVPRNLAAPAAEFTRTREAAVQRALRSIPPTHRGATRKLLPVEAMWFVRTSPRRRTELRPAYRVRVHQGKPPHDWIIYVDAANGRILKRYDNRAEATGVGLVFDPNPVIALDGSKDLLRNDLIFAPPIHAYRTVELRDLRRNGHLDGRRVTTSLTPHRVQRRDRDFRLTSDQSGFEEVMTYFHIDRAVRYLEWLGFRDRRAIFRVPIRVDADGSSADNSEYSPHLRCIKFGRGGVPDAEDAEIILHELGHAIQDAICPNFGQSHEAAAMGEGFGDYFAASFFASTKTQKYRTSIGTWDEVRDTEHTPPCLRRVDTTLTYQDYDGRADVHDNGQIWSATLWDIRKALGQHVADRIILESHFQLDGYTGFARGARAIIDADRNLYGGRHVRALIEIVRRRKIGPVK